MEIISRRGFLKKGITGAGALAVSPVLTAASQETADLVHRTLGRTGIRLPVVSFGVMRSDNPNLCKAAYDRGMRLFDTANGYLGGKSEVMLGNFFRNYPRDSFIISTKVRSSTDRQGRPDSQATSEKFMEFFNVSMGRLKMDYVDILYVHDVSNPEYLEYKPVINTVKKLKQEGRIRYIGFSTHGNEPEVINAAADQDVWDVILTQYNYRLSYIPELNAAIRKAASAGIGIVAMKTLAGGFLDRERTKPVNATAALKWVLQNPDIHTTIPGMTAFDQVDMNAKIMEDFTLSEQEKNELMASLDDPGLICSGCNQCTADCVKNLPVRDIMRAYMYAYGYGSPAMARNLLAELGTGENPCSECDTCNVRCFRHFDLKERIADISRLHNVPSEFLA
ncbi:MAG TPA: aldo/keto reductase [Bacteroidales bacterium]|jgi:predicted aldo/keto reductase-like oxidoreductase|nr:aldo/keto reductase [Bacteroidales bacterium]HOS72530.1 aldo/keto reductase [Bacteroidales bacterium]HQH23458.1 aldo/keto reductase [Bacteroidales bacterium]HQJ82034.1 aldo/keto reductase [Bacteroidales bacterium]